MFNNIGDKIKKLATVMCWVGIIISFLYAIFYMQLPSSRIIVGFLYVIVGSLASWIGSFFCYGFGQLIENTDILVEQLYEKTPRPRNKALHKAYEEESFVPPITRVETAIQWQCSVCGSMISEPVCPYCGNTSHSVKKH
jgi:hypothetical protein